MGVGLGEGGREGLDQVVGRGAMEKAGSDEEVRMGEGKMAALGQAEVRRGGGRREDLNREVE